MWNPGVPLIAGDGGRQAVLTFDGSASSAGDRVTNRRGNVGVADVPSGNSPETGAQRQSTSSLL